MTILRAKGSILSDCGKAFKFQCVGHLYEISKLPSPDKITKTQLVVIGWLPSKMKGSFEIIESVPLYLKIPANS